MSDKFHITFLVFKFNKIKIYAVEHVDFQHMQNLHVSCILTYPCSLCLFSDEYDRENEK